MAVTLTVDALLAAMRLGDSADELAEATRLLDYSTEAVTHYAPDAPDVAHNEAVIRLASQMFDQPTATRGAYSNAIRNSGAARMLLPYRIHRAGSTEDAIEVAQGAVGTPGNPVINVAVSGDLLTVTFADGNTEDYPIVAGGGTVDQIARDNAATAQDTANTADTVADGAQAEIDAHEVTAHNTDTTARASAATAQAKGEEVSQELVNHEATPHGGGGMAGVDQTARNRAEAAQVDIDNHELDTHNTDTVARAAAEAAQVDIDDHESNHPSGGGGTPLVKSSTDVTLITLSEASVTNVELPTANVAVDSGINVPAGTKTLLLNYGASQDTTTSGIDLLWFPIPIEEWERLDGVDVGDGPTQGNARFTRTWRDDNIENTGGAQARQVWLLKGNNGNIFLMTDNTGWGMHPFRVRFEVQESVSVLTDVTGNVIDGGGGGEGLTAAGITGITAAPNDAVHSSAVFPGVFGGVLHKFSFANIIALMRSTVGLGRQINPGGSTGNLGKVPVLTEDGSDFHYQLQKPAELPTIASDAPTNPSHLNSAIIYKDTPEGDTATELYYKRRHDRESVIIAMNDTSPRSFGTEHRSFGWTSISILDTAEPVPGVTPYPSTPPHWEAFIRAQNIASGLLEWRLYTDELFTTLDTIYLDMRDQGDPDTHIQNVAMTKPVNEAYWTSGTYTSTNFPFYSVAGRLARPIIRIRSADDTLSASIIHLIPIDDVREALVDEDRLHQVYADLQDIFLQHLENLTPSGGPTLLGSYTGTLSSTAWTATTLTPTAGKAMIGVVYVGANTHQTFTWHGWGMGWYPRTRFDATNAADGAWRYNVRTTGTQVIYVGRAANGRIQVRVNGVQTETFEFEFWEM